MQINKAQFVCSSERLSQLPKDSLPEFAFIGRTASRINKRTCHITIVVAPREEA